MTGVEFLWQTLAMEKGQHIRLGEAREGAGFKTRAEASRRFKWTPSTYNAHENGQNAFDLAQARIYAEAFRVDPLWLMGLSESPEPKTMAQAALGATPLQKYNVKPDPDVWKSAIEAALAELGVSAEKASKIAEVILSVAYAQLPGALGMSQDEIARLLVQKGMRQQHLSTLPE